MMSLLGLVFIVYLVSYVVNVSEPVSVISTTPIFLIVFYKLFILFYINFFNIRSLGVLFALLVSLLYVFF